MSYYVKITDTALQDLRKIAIWIAEQAQDKEIAKSFVKELRGECQKLNTFPKSGSIPKDRILKSLEYRFIVYKDYLIFYLTDDEQMIVNVMAVLSSPFQPTRSML